MRGDILVHHPYDSFSSSVEAFVEQAASDPDVLAIKQTLYRTSADSPIIHALVRAAQAGKQVVALVELKARFDEQANIKFARTLETAGVHVVYGVVGLKTHAKTCLVVRREGGGIRRYAHIGTGNYNPTTARLYEDLGLLTADPDLGADLTDLFNLLTGYSRQREYRKLLVAPVTMRPGLEALIRREMSHDDGSIVLKMNSLVDADLIDALYEASQAGVGIDLLVRGICCLRPGVPGLSEKIRVRSIVGRFLEHSRIYRFGSEQRGYDYLIGSADWMPRNLDRRVEALTPVEDPALQERLDEILRVGFDDDELAWELDPEGVWRKVAATEGVERPPRAPGAGGGARRRRSVKLEREAKLEVEPGFRMPDLSVARRVLLRAIRYDRAIRQHLPRHRRPATGPLGGVSAVPHHRGVDGEAPTVGRRPDGGRGRSTPSTEVRGRPPAEAVDLVRGLVRGGSIGPVVRLQTVRHRTRIVRPVDDRIGGRGRRRRGVGARGPSHR